MNSIRDKLIKNTLINSLGRFGTIFVWIFITPYTVVKLGNELFGIWAVTGAAIGYFSMLDLGFSWSYVKYIVEYYAKGDYKKINQVINNGFIFYTVFGSVVITLVILSSNLFLKLFHITPSLAGDARFALIGGALIIGLGRPLGGFGDLIAGLQRFDIKNGIDFFLLVINTIGTVVVLSLGYGLKGLTMNCLLNMCLNALISIMFARRLFPELSFNPVRFWDKSVMRTLFRYGYKIQANNLANLVSMQTDKMLIAHFLTVSFSAFYDLAARVATLPKSIAMFMLSAIMPVASELDTVYGKKSIKLLYNKCFKYLIITILPVSIFIIQHAQLIVSAWIGRPGYDTVASLIKILSIGYLAYSFTGTGTQVARGMAKLRYETAMSLLIAATHLGVNIFLIARYGVKGAAIGAASVLTVWSVVNIVWTYKGIIGTDYFRFFKEMFWQPLSACTISVVVTWMAFLKSTEPVTRYDCVVNLCMHAFCFFSVYTTYLVFSSYFDQYDKEVLASCHHKTRNIIVSVLKPKRKMLANSQ